MSADNKALVRRLLEESFNSGNSAVADELVAADFVDHNPLPGLPPTAEGFKQSFAVIRAAMPDMTYTIEDVIAEGDKVVVRWTTSGTNTGEMLGMPATGKKATVTGIDIFRVQDGKLAEFWLSWDQLGMLQQLGMIPPPPA